MGYDLHITRKGDWSDELGPEISLEEWLGYVRVDKSLRLDGEARATTDAGNGLGVKDASLVVWTDWEGNDDGGSQAWMWLSHGNVMAKNPDAAMRRKMVLIAVALDARLMGDEGEIYDSLGEPETSGTSGPSQARRPWWKFWSSG